MAYDPILQGAHCHSCPLRGRQVVAPTPNVAAERVRLVVVLEECTRADEKFGAYLQGHTGGLVKGPLTAAGVRPKDLHVTSSTLCRAESEKELKAASACCAPRLLRELAALPASAPILALGKYPISAVLGFAKLLVARGFVWKVKAPKLKAIHALERVPKTSTKENAAKRLIKSETLRWRRKLRGRVVFPTLAASFCSRADTWAPILRIDIARVGRWLAAPFLLEDEGREVVYPGAPAQKHPKA